MKHKNLRKLTSIGMLAFLMIAAVVIVQAQYGSSQPQTAAAAAKSTPTLTATLVDAENKAKQKAATVQVKTTGIALVDPAKAMEKPKAGQGHLHYQVDSGPIIATTATKLSFHELTSGPHKIVVMLAANDHSPLGPQQTLEVTIP